MQFGKIDAKSQDNIAKYRDSSSVWVGRWILKRAASRLEWEYSSKKPTFENGKNTNDIVDNETGEIKTIYKFSHRNNCGFVPVKKKIKLVKYDVGSASFQNLASCKSVWECPRCAVKKSAERASELKFILSKWHKNHDNQAYLATFTIPHEQDDELKQIKSYVSEAWRQIFTGENGRDLFNHLGIKYYCRKLELTHGLNGWHPHLHVIFFNTRRVNLELYRALLFDRWKQTVLSQGKKLEAGSEKWFEIYGVDVATTENKNKKALAKYITKMGLADEVALTVTKKGKKGSRSPWQILSDYVVTGNKSDGKLWQSFCDNIRGARQLTWSQPRSYPSIRKIYYRPPEKRLEIVSSFEMEQSDWKKIAKDPLEQSILLSAMENGSKDFLKSTFRGEYLSKTGLQVKNLLIKNLEEINS